MMTNNDAPKTSAIVSELERLYASPAPELNFTNPFETLIAAMLSAQCTDKRVNLVTETLFEVCKTPADYLSMGQEKLEEIIKSVGLYRTKSANIIKTCRVLENEHNGEVPNEFDKLVRLPGVGRKVANVVLANAFGVPAFAVDTHVHRVANRLGLASSKTPEQTERQLTAIIPQSMWLDTHHRLIFHGRRACRAVNPLCGSCTLSSLCGHARSVA